MGLDLAGRDPRAAELLELAGEHGGFSATTVLRRGGDRLASTRVLQPLLTAVVLGITEALARHGLRPSIALGHSLGELAAWSALGGVSSESAIALAAERGRILDEVSRTHAERVGMLALPRLDTAGFERALALAREHGSVDVATHNAPGRWVLSGERRALQGIARTIGGRFVETSGAWHWRGLAPAREQLRAALASIANVAPTPGLILDFDGSFLGDRGRAVLTDALVDQVDGTVRFAAGMETLRRAAERGQVRELWLIGPAKIARGLVRENLGIRDLESAERPRVRVVETPADIDAQVRRARAREARP